MSTHKSKIFRSSLDRFGERLREWRRAQGLTQKQVAENIGIKRSYYSLVETGKKTPSGRFLAAFGEAYGLEVLVNLLRKEEDMPSINRIPESITNEFHQRSSIALPSKEDARDFIERKRAEQMPEKVMARINSEALNPGLRDFLSDQQLLADLRISYEEIQVLIQMHIYSNFPITKNLYISALADYRQHLSKLAEEKRYKE